MLGALNDFFVQIKRRLVLWRCIRNDPAVVSDRDEDAHVHGSLNSVWPTTGEKIFSVLSFGRTKAPRILRAKFEGGFMGAQR